MELSTIEYDKKGHIAYVTLNRPDKLNAMNQQVHDELAWAWADVRDDPKIRVAILSGNGRCFSAGADLSGGAPDEAYQYTG
ncbi:MAG: enoyl-CoA hydratase/isomerase family protein, partial [Alphaproteobacteria bacterium]|nr:enoyl-CoA hydratase/isomerase family protein [Alphaproteobacteria bacterium]